MHRGREGGGVQGGARACPGSAVSTVRGICNAGTSVEAVRVCQCQRTVCVISNAGHCQCQEPAGKMLAEGHRSNWRIATGGNRLQQMATLVLCASCHTLTYPTI